jgi:hypothetical protein
MLVAPELCDDIAKMRRKFQRIPKSQLLFLDETSIRLSEAPTSTLVLPDQQPYIVVTETESYSTRLDMIACINGDQVFPESIYTPKERLNQGAKGINTEMLIDYILNILGQATAALDNPPLTLVLDQSTIHSTKRLQEAFNERGGHVTDIVLMPTASAKRLSPLDNSLFHEWKEAVRKHGPMTLINVQQVMAKEWINIKKEQIQRYYFHCGLTTSKKAYFDCPDPVSHHHT